MNNGNLTEHINNKLQEYKNKLKSINSSILPFGDIDEDKKLFSLKRELYNEYVKDVKGNYYGFFLPFYIEEQKEDTILYNV
jgi:hypothetical protein